MQNFKQIKNKDILFYLFLFVFPFIYSIFLFIGYGTGDQLEQLPIIFRNIDETYLINDFFVNASENSIVRLYYSDLISFLSLYDINNISFIFKILTLIVNISNFFIIYFISKKIFNSNNFSILISCLIALFFPLINLGGHGNLFSAHLTPMSLVTPLVFISIYFFYLNKIFFFTISCILTSIIHPLIGLETGWILIFLNFVLNSFNRNLNFKYLIKLTVAILIFIITTVFLTYSHLSNEVIEYNKFIQIILFRMPHHYLPSSFDITEYFFLFFFILMIFDTWKNNGNHTSLDIYAKYSLLLIITFITALTFLSYFFVEIIPFKIWVQAQLFRLYFIINFIGILFLSKFISDLIIYKELSKIKFVILISIIILFCIKFTDFREIHKLLILLSIIFLIIFYYLNIKIILLSVLSSLFILIFVITQFRISTTYIEKQNLYNFSKIEYCNKYLDLEIIKCFSDYIGHLFFAYYNNSPNLDHKSKKLIDFIQSNTDLDSVFLSPPGFGFIRVFAKRSLLVDFKGFPFTDYATLEWYNRFIDAYGKPQKKGFEMLAEINENYQNINDDKIKVLKEKYNFDYAITNNENKTKYKIVYTDGTNKILYLN